MDDLLTLQNENKQLLAALSTMDASAKMLVRRDLDLRRAYEKLKSLEHNKSEFISIAAHQLRTPLSAIRWSQQLLLDEDLGLLNTEQKNMVTQSQVSVKRMVRLVNNLLDADHLELGKEHFVKKETNLVQIIHESVNDLKLIASEKNINLQCDTHQNSIIRIIANADRIKEVLLNLIDNAVKYTPSGGVVTCDVTVIDTNAVCKVTDNGIGIPAHYQYKIFERFMRAENAKRVDADGSGLGLYIVKKIIENHEGTIQFTSEEGSGTVFTFTLPIVLH